MSHRRPDDPRQAHLEDVLRQALRLAVDPVEPAADGLDRIRAKISARQPVLQFDWRTATPVGILGWLLRRLEPVGIWLRYAFGAVADRFRPDPDRAGRLGWLRPAAAVATGLFVVTAASWAIAALPQAIRPTTEQHGYTGQGGNRPAPASSSRSHSRPGGNIGPGTGSSSALPTSCKPTSPAHRKSGSASPTRTPSPSPSQSPSPSSSPSSSPSPSGTSSGSPSPSNSPSASAPSNSPMAPGSASRSRTSTPGAQSSLAPLVSRSCGR